MIDWPTKIVELLRVKQEIQRLDIEGFFPYTFPAVGAPPELLAKYEAGTELLLDPVHRSFLAAANGWKAFFETQDLLSVEQLAAGEHRDVFTEWIDSAPPQARKQGFTSATLLPIAADLEMPFFAAMPVVGEQVTPQVLLLDPTGILETFENFGQYFDSVISDTQSNLADFRAGAFN